MNPKIIIITMGISRIVKPIVQKYNVTGIIECASRKTANDKDTVTYKVMRYLYSFIKKDTITLNQYAKLNNIPYYYMNNGSDKKLENWVKLINPDVIIVHSMSQLLKSNIFEIPKYKTINLHPALLPKYRGPFPDFWMYYNKENRGGVTVHYIDEGEDTGNIIYQEEYDIPLGMKSPEMLNLSISEIGVRLLFKALDNIENLPSMVQEKKSPTQRARNINENEHRDIIDWENWDIERIWHLLRGTELWLNALDQPRGIYSGQRWVINDYKKCDMKEYTVSKIYKENKNYFVACKDGKIYLEVRFNLKKFILNIIKGNK